MLKFKKIILHNFGSYGHAEVELNNKGICLVSGRNNYKKDNALSNGSGKSFLWSGICFALTGETISGLKTNLKNINVENDVTSYVTVEFEENSDAYIVTRHITPKSDLKINKNGLDISGKGIRESEKKLGEVLPDLTKDLIASTIIIGQGMPNKFSSFSPSGRKELLEKLTKSDFMVEDIKQRVSERASYLNGQLRTCEDTLLVNNTQLNTLNKALETNKKELEKAVKPDFDQQIEELTQHVATLNKEIEDLTSKSTEASKEVDLKSEEMFKLMAAKTEDVEVEKVAYETAFKTYYQEKSVLDTKINSLVREINQLKNIKDICPTCGQKLQGVTKPDYTAQEQELQKLQLDSSALNNKVTECNSKHKTYQIEINKTHDEAINCLKTEITALKSKIEGFNKQTATFSLDLDSTKTKLSKITYDKTNWDKYYSKLITTIEELNKEINQLNNIIQLTVDNRTDLLEHISVIRKMDNLIKRDFRGYLLENIIKYVDQKAKDYCSIVFGTRELNVYLDGNALDISYCNKMFDNLSGGEKQRVDLILQFAIRDMLNAYLNSGSNILVLDEITDFLDKQSCAAIMKLIEYELTTIESVFVVSHHAAELELPIDSEIKIVKNEYGISEIV